MPLEPGQSLGHYRIERLLGQGGIGAVFLAEDTKLHRKIALKVLPEATAADAGRLARFGREARAVAALNHPHIVTIYSVEEVGCTHFLTNGSTRRSRTGIPASERSSPKTSSTGSTPTLAGCRSCAGSARPPSSSRRSNSR